VRHWVDGLVIGSELFVRETMRRVRSEAEVARHRLAKATPDLPDAAPSAAGAGCASCATESERIASCLLVVSGRATWRSIAPVCLSFACSLLKPRISRPVGCHFVRKAPT
jgi:hypothetical protein